ncbi:redox-regulated ATPase YchF [Acholeplasma sp. OttesenSCG-928-E16]|nr:redox-regulated ATPase YchF [Acholeplasma sp. OttesenSCG-928-E16]
MMLKTGIVGLPNVGKSTLFNALTKSKVLAANFPFATIDPNVGIVTVSDERLDFLSNMFNPKKKTPTVFEFIDIAGLVKGASLGEGLGNQFLSHIREVDAIAQVVRCFIDPNVIHVDGKIEPLRDIETIKYELYLADLDIINKRIPKLLKKAQAKIKEAVIELEVLSRIKEALEKEISPLSLDFTPDELKLIKSFSLLSLKPMLIIANIAENEISNPMENVFYNDLIKYGNDNNVSIVFVSAQVEAEISSLDEKEQLEFLESYGLTESGLKAIINKSYALLGLKTFLTAGEDECRAWTFKDGMKAPECAGIIHSDFEKGFIKAEVVSFEDLVKFGSMAAVKENGRARLEGKEYLVKDGDIIVFRFNV